MKVTVFKNYKDSVDVDASELILHLPNGKQIHIEPNQYFYNILNIMSHDNHNMRIYATGINHFCIEVGEDIENK